MKNPLDTVKGTIVDFDPQKGEVTIVAKYDDWFTASKRQYKQCLVQMIDSRPLSDKQRRACYALIREISDYTGMGVDSTKEWIKIKFLTEDMLETADKIFSLSNAPMSLVCAFQKFLINFIIDWDIPTSFPLLDMVDDIDSYVYSCAVHKKCCICGRKADMHHVDRVGMGADRTMIIHEGLEVISLCRLHHMEVHQYSKQKFFSKYHIDKGVPADKTICRVYGLKMNKDTIS